MITAVEMYDRYMPTPDDTATHLELPYVEYAEVAEAIEDCRKVQRGQAWFLSDMRCEECMRAGHDYPDALFLWGLHVIREGEPHGGTTWTA